MMMRKALWMVLPVWMLACDTSDSDRSSRDDDDEEEEDEEESRLYAGDNGIASMNDYYTACEENYDSWADDLEDEDDAATIVEILNAVAAFELQGMSDYSNGEAAYNVNLERQDSDEREDTLDEYLDELERPHRDCYEAANNFSTLIDENIEICMAYVEWRLEQVAEWAAFTDAQTSYDTECMENDDDCWGGIFRTNPSHTLVPAIPRDQVSLCPGYRQWVVQIPTTNFHESESGLMKQVMSCPEGAEIDTETQTCTGDDVTAVGSSVRIEVFHWNGNGDVARSYQTGFRTAYPSGMLPGAAEALRSMVHGESARFWVPRSLGYPMGNNTAYGPLGRIYPSPVTDWTIWEIQVAQ